MVDSSQAYDHHAENEKIRAQGRGWCGDESPHVPHTANGGVRCEGIPKVEAVTDGGEFKEMPRTQGFDTCQQADLATNGAFYCTRDPGHDGPCCAVPRLQHMGTMLIEDLPDGARVTVEPPGNPNGPLDMPPTIDYSAMSMQNMNGRELGQRIVGEMSCRSNYGEHHFFVIVPNEAVAGVLVALVDAGWKLCQRSWYVLGGTTLEAWS